LKGINNNYQQYQGSASIGIKDPVVISPSIYQRYIF